ncbi:MAG: hypothetical protein M3N02_00555, partial [Pseudomonadota bacterium]|nr:hypothetical protein [Pseudomonadota bacterium]
MAAALLAQPQAAVSQIDWNHALVEVRDLSSLSLSPAGDRLLFRVDRADLASNVEQLAWMEAETKDGRLSDLGSAGEGLFDDPGVLREGAPKWLANGDAVVRQYDGKAIGIWRYERDDSRFRPLIVSDSDILDLRLEPGDTGLAYQVAATRAEIQHAEEEEREKGVLIDQHVDLAQGLYRAGRVNGRLASQRLIGYWFMRAGLLDDAPRQWRRWDSVSGTNSALGPPSPPPPFVPPALDQVASLDGPGGQVTAHWSGQAGRIEWQAAGAAAIACRAKVCRTLRANWLAWRVPGRELVAGLSDRFGRTTLALWSIADNRLRIVIRAKEALGGSRRFSVPCAVATARAYCVAAGPVSPPRLVAVDLGTGRIRTLFDPNAGLRAAYSANIERTMLQLDNGLPVA